MNLYPHLTPLCMVSPSITTNRFTGLTMMRLVAFKGGLSEDVILILGMVIHS